MPRQSQPGRLREPLRITVTADGMRVGRDPWADCAWCGVGFDPAEYDGCPTCALRARESEAAQWAAIRLAYAAEAGTAVH